MALNTIIVLSLFFTLCLCQFNSANFQQTVCLYSSANDKILSPLKLLNTDCKTNTSYCMNQVYKYSNFQFVGPTALKPAKGEVAMFLSQAENGDIDYVSFLNANQTTKMNVTCQITGATPTPIIFKDDPDDVWFWNEQQNKGSFLWDTRPTYTDGVIIGHITFVDNYCVRTSYRSTTTGVAPINTLSVFSGTVAKPVRILSVPYTAGSTFEFCQYPRTATVYKNATCPNSQDGEATVSIAYGPSSVGYTWYNHDGDQIATTAKISNLRPGTYHVIVDDKTSMGCTAERSVVISAPFLWSPSVSTTPFSCTPSKGSATVSPNGGTGSFTYKWLKGQTVIGTQSSISGLDIGTYTVCVTDSCQSVNCTNFEITTTGCCGDGICQLNEVCGTPSACPGDCGACCPPGTKKVGEECQVCPAGSRSTTYQATACSQCPANTFNAGGDDVCAPCPENTISAAGSDKCVRCQPGTVRPQGESSCVTCGAGKYADPCGGCVDAPAGSYAVDGSWAPTPCDPGHFSSSTGAVSCAACPIGTYANSVGASSCTTCPTGTTTQAEGAHHPLFCL